MNLSFLPIVQQAWADLSDSDRALWYAIASFLPCKQKRDSGSFLNAHQLFVKYNCIRVWSGLTVLTTPQFTSIPYTDPEPRLYRDGASIFLEIQSGVYTDDTYALVKITQPLKNTNYYFKRFLKIFNLDTSGDAVYNLDPIFTEYWGSIPVAGDVCGFSFKMFSTLTPDIKATAFYKLTVQATP
jgi:hypothetical protein